MPRLRSAQTNHLPKYVMLRKGRYYLEPKGVLKEALGNKSSHALGKSFGEMFDNYHKLTAGLHSGERVYTLRELVSEYLSNVSAPRKAVSTYKTDEKSSKTILRVFSDFRPEDIRTKHIYIYQRERRNELREKHKARYEQLMEEKYFNAPKEMIPDNPGETLCNRTVNKEISFLSAVMKYAVRIGVIEQSPCVDIEYLPVDARKRYVTDEEFDAFCDFARQRNRLVAAYANFRYITGRRDCEVLGLLKEHVRPDGIVFYLAKKSKKGAGAPVLQEWNDDLRAVYAELLQASWRPASSTLKKKGARPRPESEYVVCNRSGNQYTPDGWRSIFDRVMRAAVEEGVLEKRFTSHDIRSKTATDMETVADACETLAHSDEKVTMENYRGKIERIKAHSREEDK